MEDTSVLRYAFLGHPPSGAISAPGCHIDNLRTLPHSRLLRLVYIAGAGGVTLDMRRDGTRPAAETDAASSEALKGGLAGAAKVPNILVFLCYFPLLLPLAPRTQTLTLRF